MIMLSWPACVAAALAGVLLDRWLGEPRRWHPLVGFGRMASAVANCLNRPESGALRQRLAGLAAWSLVVLGPAALAAWLVTLAADVHPALAWALHAVALYFALGACSLAQHIAPIADALTRNDLPAARTLTARIVSRDTADADAEALARAACESALENGNDAIFGALFWFLVGGAPAVIVFRLANTLDAMWGYRTPRWEMFGWAAARIDDVLNLVPARLTALSYALLGATAQAMRCWRTQAAAWSSPNAGPVMAAGAGAVGVALGGGARYHGEWEERPPLGIGDAPGAAHVHACLQLVQRTLWLWLGVAMLSVPVLSVLVTAGGAS
ncbi:MULTISPECIES: adenosylcobinamide-phosphate synthase CbiB [unclassified Cupriavidus]|uniref:adenosylcobinamide-phosphate synthase CbiB n=1 Tax=unclassified Cupriavidus TaxID=2640874 RepID=UPI001C00332F|nr:MULTISPECIES: adenosylcobinamide-phosphate synthase CbiB [unclassified Cupriavidus]MCA3183167.1 cobalamin biosynthesis protein [Cupriavidus sp.]MCA3192887.1 cobalamin biosynthesis protein [Cupriavidus sp.]MCA3195088.1 cobalamin biosynthesis protein [Cupriavidus sp.]MCA3204058.1 cobalamin biosynthesis protein [Cupriavidus sp.]MCA3209642.1 cobalamin biosynthesis protein [Cupriavidus sp.]